MAIFKATLGNGSMAPKDKKQVNKTGNYLAQWLATTLVLVDKSTPTVAAPYNDVPHGKGARHRGPWKTLLFGIPHRFAHRVPLTKLVELDGDVHLNLTTLIVTILA